MIISNSTGVNFPRHCSAEEKVEFFRLLAVHNSVAKVADMLGYTRMTCYAWAVVDRPASTTKQPTGPAGSDSTYTLDSHE